MRHRSQSVACQRKGYVRSLKLAAARIASFAACAAASALPGLAETPPPDLAGSAKAILDTHCSACHGQARMSGLDLRSAASARKGGTRGPSIVPGQAAKSLLVHAVTGTEELSMPPGDARLSEKDIKVLKDWINAGANWPENAVANNSPSWWSFQQPEHPELPDLDDDWVRSPIDAFVLAKLNAQGMQPAEPASRSTLARRAYFDLHGLPPTPEAVQQFVEDPSPDAYEKLIDRLLESERYGERWGRYWLDLVRYADTSGFETDHYYTTAWRYRDYVIESFNRDTPYTTFVREQIAADELWPTDMDLEGTLTLPAEKRENVRRRIGTSLFTLGAFPVEYTYYGDLYRAEWRAEAVDTIGSAFLGLTLECARCHDHKSDPISQRDYYRLSAFFTGSVEKEIPLVSLFDVQTSTRSFPLLEQARILKRMAKATQKGLSPDQRRAMLERLGEAYLQAPEPYESAKVLDHEENVPETYVLAHGDFRKKGELVKPGFPAALPAGPPLDEPEGTRFVPRRRAALAEWLTSDEQPLLGRVMVNRIWQHHFGRGLVRTPNDFGREGEAPTHPGLLDWLALEFARSGWSIKAMHRQMMLSSTYRLASLASDESIAHDPDNRLFGRMSRQRLDADAIRDSILAIAGTLNLKMGGVGVIPPLTSEEILAARTPHLWPANPDPSEHARRTVYLQVKRSMALPMLQIFDAPDTAQSCARRETSTVAPQALAMMNSAFVLEQAGHFASRLRAMAREDLGGQVDAGWTLALGRYPTNAERRIALDFLRRNSLQQLCLMLFNMNEFVYVD